MPRFISTQSIILELPLHVQHLPALGTEVQGSVMEGTVVAGGFYVVATVARQGIAACIASPLGTGPNSVQARHSLGREGISVLSREIVGDIGLRIAAIDGNGVRTTMASPGVEAEPDARELAELVLHRDDWVLVSLNDLAYPQSAKVLSDWATHLDENVHLALAGGPQVAGVDLDVLVKVLGRADVLTLNKHQVDTVRSRLGRGPIQDLLRRYVRANTMLVLRDGARGVTIQQSATDMPRGVPAIIADVKDTTGVAAAHTGVLLASLMQGKSLENAAERANAAATLALQGRGYYRIPTAAQIDDLLASRRIGR